MTTPAAAARQYVKERGIVRREPVYSANRFERLIGDIHVDKITTDHLAAYRAKCHELKLSPRTIESSIADLLTVILAVTGQRPTSGKRLAVPRPQPKPVAIKDINSCWPMLPEFVRQWVVLTYWTGLRLADSMNLLVTLQDGLPSEVIHFQASKTGTRHVFPVVPWLTAIMRPVILPFSKSTDFSRKIVRHEIGDACRRTKTAVWLPKHLRQRAITEWSRANGMAGSIIHGSGLKVLNHYVDPLTVLETAAPRVRLPDCFGNTAGETESLVSMFSRLDPAGQRLIRETARQLTSG